MTEVSAPVAGRLVPLSAVPDQVFAGEMVGSGVAIEPSVPADGAEAVVVAPVEFDMGVVHGDVLAPVDPVLLAALRQRVDAAEHALDDAGQVAVHDVSLTVSGGEIVGIAGVSGNGQRQLVEVLAGQREAQSGSIALHGAPQRLSYSSDAGTPHPTPD